MEDCARDCAPSSPPPVPIPMVATRPNCENKPVPTWTALGSKFPQDCNNNLLPTSQDNTKDSCNLTICKILGARETEPLPRGQTVRCCKNICGPVPSSPCGLFNTSTVFNACRFRNAFRTSCCLKTGCTNYCAVNPRMRGLGKKISSNRIHTVESVNDLRSWSICADDRRRHFLEQMVLSGNEEYDSEQSSDDPQQRFDNLRARETGRGGGGGGGAGNGNEGDSSGMISGSRPASGASGGSGYDGDVSRSGAGTREGSAPGGVGGRSAGGIGGRSADGIGGRSSSADGIEGRSAGGLGGRSAMGTGTGPMSKDSQTPPLALANLIDALDAEEKKRLFEELNKAENLSPIIASKNEEIQNLLDQIKDLESKCGFGGGGNNEGIEGGRGSRSSSSRGRSGQEGIGGRSALGRNSGGGNNASNSNAGALGSNDRTAGSNVEAAGSCIIETTLDFDDTMKPIKTDTRMNYVVNAKKNSGGATARAAEESGYGSRKGSSKLSLNPEVIQEAKCIYDAIGCDLNAMARLTVMQYQTVLQVLTAVVQAEYDSPESDRNSSTSAEGIQEPEQTYTYELETVCDFQVGNNGDLTLVNAQGRVIPSESYARVSSGAHPLGSGSNLAQPEVFVERGVQSAPTGSPGNTSARQVLQGSGLLDMNSGGDEALDFPDPPPSNTVDWGRLEKDKERRLNETDCLVELSTLRTNMELLRQAYEQEKARIKAYEERLADCDDLSRQLCQERGTANELKYVIDQQQQQINSLTQLIQQLQSGRESGASGLTTLGQGVPDSSSPNTSVFPNDGSNGGGGGVLSPSEAELNLASSEASPVRGRNSGLPPSVSQRGSKVDNSGAATSASVVLSNNKEGKPGVARPSVTGGCDCGETCPCACDQGGFCCGRQDGGGNNPADNRQLAESGSSNDNSERPINNITAGSVTLSVNAGVEADRQMYYIVCGGGDPANSFQYDQNIGAGIGEAYGLSSAPVNDTSEFLDQTQNPNSLSTRQSRTSGRSFMDTSLGTGTVLRPSVPAADDCCGRFEPREPGAGSFSQVACAEPSPQGMDQSFQQGIASVSPYNNSRAAGVTGQPSQNAQPSCGTVPLAYAQPSAGTVPQAYAQPSPGPAPQAYYAQPSPGTVPQAYYAQPSPGPVPQAYVQPQPPPERSSGPRGISNCPAPLPGNQQTRGLLNETVITPREASGLGDQSDPILYYSSGETSRVFADPRAMPESPELIYRFNEENPYCLTEDEMRGRVNQYVALPTSIRPNDGNRQIPYGPIPAARRINFDEYESPRPAGPLPSPPGPHPCALSNVGRTGSGIFEPNAALSSEFIG